ncbi:EF-hand domain-containing protein [Sphingomonas sp. AOB5]|uniref:EF-hand domain-containing protein n=1 Tax=Sphingomonas sp. AOB5 TaxID=3034017 RepID=UPI0023F986D3|nr:EF-hand domain-containing protein [Sphingomonas sp. AOB5]MDF7775348.1 EF-hand domain-containing protein [Sphingomonas sp. AOB5]
MKKLILGAALAAAPLAVFATPAAAQDGGAMMAAMFPDPDGDGATSKAELLTASAARFAQLDKNKDGKLSESEREAGPGGRMLGRADTDGDGSVSADEMKAAATMRFDRLDTNKDGKIDATERAAAMERMRAMRPGN